MSHVCSNRYRALSTEVAELILDDPRIAVPDAESVRQSDQIRATAERRRQAQDRRPGGHTRHVVSTIVAESDGDMGASKAS